MFSFSSRTDLCPCCNAWLKWHQRFGKGSFRSLNERSRQSPSIPSVAEATRSPFKQWLRTRQFHLPCVLFRARLVQTRRTRFARIPSRSLRQYRRSRPLEACPTWLVYFQKDQAHAARLLLKMFPVVKMYNILFLEPSGPDTRARTPALLTSDVQRGGVVARRAVFARLFSHARRAVGRN